MILIARLIPFALTAIPFAALLAQDESPPVTRESLRQSVADLDSDDFSIRRNATHQLLRSGSVAVPLVREAGESPSLEVVVRSVEILYRMALEGDAGTKRLAEDALAELAASSDRRVAYRARRAINRQQQRLIARLVLLGGRVTAESGRVTGISFSSSPVQDEDLAVLRHFPDVVSLSLNSTKVGDAGMKHVIRLSKLERLDLYRTQVGNEGLKQIKTLRNLKWLPMGETKVTDAGLVHLRQMPQLEYLGLRGDDVTDAGLVHLKALKNLTGLYLGETKVTDAGLIHIRHMDQMRHLRLHTVRVTDAGLDHLRGMTRLTYIIVYETGITDKGASRLKEWFPDCQVVREK